MEKKEENKIIDSLLNNYDLNSIKKLIDYDIKMDEEEYMEKKYLDHKYSKYLYF